MMKNLDHIFIAFFILAGGFLLIKSSTVSFANQGEIEPSGNTVPNVDFPSQLQMGNAFVSQTSVVPYANTYSNPFGTSVSSSPSSLVLDAYYTAGPGASQAAFVAHAVKNQQ